MSKTFDYYYEEFTNKWYIKQYEKDPKNAKRVWYLLGKGLQDNLNYSEGEGFELECRIHALSNKLKQQKDMLDDDEEDSYGKY